MAETTNSTSRRAVIMALAGTPFLAGTIAATISTEADAETIPPGADGPDAYSIGWGYGEKSGTELALCHVARAWIDRWEACGGDFGFSHNPDESLRGILRGMPEVSFWTPTDEGNPKLAPHLWLVEPEHQSGAVKVLDAFLDLVPGLRDTVFEIVGGKLLARSGGRA